MTVLWRESCRSVGGLFFFTNAQNPCIRSFRQSRQLRLSECRWLRRSLEWVGEGSEWTSDQRPAFEEVYSDRLRAGAAIGVAGVEEGIDGGRGGGMYGVRCSMRRQCGRSEVVVVRSATACVGRQWRWRWCGGKRSETQSVCRSVFSQRDDSGTVAVLQQESLLKEALGLAVTAEAVGRPSLNASSEQLESAPVRPTRGGGRSTVEELGRPRLSRLLYFTLAKLPCSLQSCWAGHLDCHARCLNQSDGTVDWPGWEEW